MTCVSKLKEMRRPALRISGEVHFSRKKSSVEALKKDVWCVEEESGVLEQREEMQEVQGLLGYQNHYSFTLCEMGSHCR